MKECRNSEAKRRFENTHPKVRVSRLKLNNTKTYKVSGITKIISQRKEVKFAK